MGLLRCDTGGFGLLQCGIGGGTRGLGLGEPRLGSRQRLGRRDHGLGLAAFGFQPRQCPGGPVGARLGGLAGGAAMRLVRRRRRSLLGGTLGGAASLVQRGTGCLGLRLGRRQPGRHRPGLGREPGLLAAQPGQCLVGGAGGDGGAFQILLHLPQPRLGGLQRDASARFLGGKPLGLHPATLQQRAGQGLGLARRRQGVRGGMGGHGGARGLGLGRLQRRLGLCPLATRQKQLGLAAPGQDGEPFGLGLARQAGEIAVAGSLLGLPAQPLALALQLGAQVLGAGQVALRLAQLQLRLVAPGAQAGDAGGLLQHLPAVLGPGADQRRDLALADHAGGAGAGAEVGEHRRHVAPAHLAPVDAIAGALATLDAADDLQLRHLGIGGRGEAGGIFQPERDLGMGARGAGAGAGEDHVVHPGAAHGAGVGFAHGPAQRLHDIGLAAAVRADDAGQPGQDLDRLRLGEGFEAGDAQAGERGGAQGALRRLAVPGRGADGAALLPVTPFIAGQVARRNGVHLRNDPQLDPVSRAWPASPARRSARRGSRPARTCR